MRERDGHIFPHSGQEKERKRARGDHFASIASEREEEEEEKRERRKRGCVATSVDP